MLGARVLINVSMAGSTKITTEGCAPCAQYFKLVYKINWLFYRPNDETN